MTTIGTRRASLSGEDFLSELQQDVATNLFAVVGAARKSDADGAGEMLFTQDGTGRHWAKIPLAMIDSVEILGRTIIRNEICILARVFLKKPEHPEAGVLAELLEQQGVANAEGTTLVARGGTLPLRPSDGTLPLRNDGTLPLRNDGTLPLNLSDLILTLIGSRLGTGFVPFGWRFGNG